MTKSNTKYDYYVYVERSTSARGGQIDAVRLLPEARAPQFDHHFRGVAAKSVLAPHGRQRQKTKP